MAPRGPTRNLTFADMRRRWGSSCPPDQLSRLLQSSIAADYAMASSRLDSSPNMLMIGREKRIQQIRNPTTGRTLEDAIDVDGNERRNASSTVPSFSVLHRPLLLTADNNPNTTEAANNSADVCRMNVLSTFEVAAKKASNSARASLDLRDHRRAEEDQLRRLERSLQHQKKLLTQLEGERAQALVPIIEQSNITGGSMTPEMRAVDEREESIRNCIRVIAQLNRQLATIGDAHETDGSDRIRVEAESRACYNEFVQILQRHRDPLYETRPEIPRNRVLQNVMCRQMGLAPSGLGQHRLSRGLLGNALSATEMRKSLLLSRISHGATINTHLSYPIYCLRFDRTGRYFITGADDYLAKLYCLGVSVSVKAHDLDRDSYIRGAVLVCTLRGHAGVINDINVSSDNAFLATASEDGDCRVWGLKDGTPIAILRGHVGGANMVAWSDLTPYRLITAASDGYARVWDIKEACLRRYKPVIGMRRDYSSKKETRIIHRKEDSKPDSKRRPPIDPSDPPLPTLKDHQSEAPPDLFAVEEEPGSTSVTQTHYFPGTTQESLASTALPPLPPPVATGGQEPMDSVPLPPLPPPGGHSPQDSLIVPPLLPLAAEANDPGPFVPGDSIDRGVRLLSKLQHGASCDESVVGPGTRSRRAAVKVLCVAVCPTGRHFTTGAADGMCRVFSADDDEAVAIVDAGIAAQAGFPSVRQVFRRYSNSSRLLLTLKGHLSPITDLEYSSSGDRILSASQKDGVVRIWSWTVDPASTDQVSGSSVVSPSARNCQVSHIVIKLTNPNSSRAEERQQGRRRPSRTAGSNVSCDVAAWLRDDRSIITSQCELAKQTSTEIVPGSQYIFIWDSYTGQCLLGIAGAHTVQCAVVVPHPTEPSLVCSAGADGKAQLWNVETGKCIFAHQNTVEFGPIEARDRGQISAYLDGSFSPDGAHLVLTDDAGRVTVLDCAMQVQSPRPYPTWMREQYFANDYYDLLYDPDGYCIERGSEQPPHLAPRGVRCSHSGVSWGEMVNNNFKLLTGPIPVAEYDIWWDRIKRRSRGDLPYQKRVQRGNIVGQYDHATTTLVSASGEAMPPSKVTSGVAVVAEAAAEEVSASRASPQLSRNWRWRDYSDVLMEEGLNNDDDEQPDSDDDSFEPANVRNGAHGGSESDGGADAPEERVPEGFQPDNRQSSRNRRRRYVDGEPSSDEELVEYMSSNNTPSGPFVSDYDFHYFRIPQSSRLHRRWLRRNESDSSYNGTKSYVPQVGDSVVYIPRAHHETITNFPSLVPPWQSWPDEAVWPVVCCSVRYIRYRFPFKTYFPQSPKVCRSVVAILSLELTGIPELSEDDAWPKPSFVRPAKTHMFEVGLFESDEIDFVIPLSLYVSRLSALERAHSYEKHPRVEAFYANNESEEDGFLTPYPGLVLNLVKDDSLGHPTLSRSGYQSVQVQWDADGSSDTVSPWELRLAEGSDESDRPQLSAEEKRNVRDALAQIQQMDRVRDNFLFPVDTRKYCDYLMRIEVPMHLEFVKNRLESNYYSNRLSVIGDIKLIRDNSTKYNGELGDLTLLGGQMLEKFTGLVLSSEEHQEYSNFETQVELKALEGRPHNEGSDSQPEPQPVRASDVSRRREISRASEDTSAAARVENSIRRSRRTRSSTSALESLPPPQSVTPPARVRIRMRRESNRTNRRESASRSVLEASPASVPVAALDAGTRGRTTRNPRVQQSHTRQLRSSASTMDNRIAGGRTATSSLTTSASVLQRTRRNQQTSRRLRSSTDQDDRENPHLDESAATARGRMTRTRGTASAIDASTQRRTSQRRQSNRQGHIHSDGSAAEAIESDFRAGGSSESEESGDSADPNVSSMKSSFDKAGRDRIAPHHNQNEIPARRSTRSHCISHGLSSGAQHGTNGRRVTRTATRSKELSSRHKDSGAESEDSSHLLDTEESDSSKCLGTNPRSRRSNRKTRGGRSKRAGYGQPRGKIAGGRNQPRDQDIGSANGGTNPEEDQTRYSRRSFRLRNDGKVGLGSAHEDSQEDTQVTSRVAGGVRSTRRTAASSEPGGEDDTVSRQRRPTRKRAIEVKESQNRRRGNRSAAPKSYEVPSSSEFGSESDSVSVEVKVRAKVDGKRKKAHGGSAAKPPPKKQRFLHDHSSNKQWPHGDRRDVRSVTLQMLHRLREKDEHDAFGRPVSVQFPVLADEYNSKISEPMDYETIEERRLPSYESFQDLQEDLKLVFNNCIEFNPGKNPLSNLAR